MKEALKATISTELVQSVDNNIRFAKVALSFGAENRDVLCRVIGVLFIVNIMGSLIQLMRHFDHLVLLGATVQPLNLWIGHTEHLIIFLAPPEEFLRRFLILLVTFFVEGPEPHRDDRYWFTLVIILNLVGNHGRLEELLVVIHTVDFVTNFDVISPLVVISVSTKRSHIHMENVVSLNLSFVIEVKFDIYDLRLCLGVAVHVDISGLFIFRNTFKHNRTSSPGLQLNILNLLSSKNIYFVADFQGKSPVHFVLYSLILG